MESNVTTSLDNFTEIFKQDNTILAPKRETVKDFQPIIDNLKRDELGIVNQLQEDGSLDGGDSAHRTGILAFCNSKTDQNLLGLFEDKGIMVRHPQQIPWNNWKNCSRDQLFGFIAGCWRDNQIDIVKRLLDKHENRFPPFTCQNTEADYEGTTKFPPIGDPMGPHDIMYLRICSGDTNAHLNLLGQFVLQIEIETASKDVTNENNQLLLKSIVCGRLNLFVQVHPNYKESIRHYWSGWRGQPQIAESLINVVELELNRYIGLPEADSIIPSNIFGDFKDVSLLSIVNYVKDEKINSLEKQLKNSSGLSDVKTLSSKMFDGIFGLINKRNLSIKNKLNAIFPSISVLDQQNIAIHKSIIQLENISPQLGIYIDKSVVFENILFQIKTEIADSKDEDVIINTIEPIILFDKQLLSLEIEFNLTIPKYNLTLLGKINGASALSIENNNLIIRNALNFVSIDNVIFKFKTSIGDIELATDVSVILKEYIEILNDKLFKNPIIVNLNWDKSYSLKLQELVQDPNTEIIGEETQVLRFVKKACIRINEVGIAALIELDKTQTLDINEETQIAKQVTKQKVVKLFKQFNSDFNAIWKGYFEPINSKDLISVNLTKAEISSILNELLAKPFAVRQNLPELVPSFNFDQRIEAKNSDIDCQSVRTDFNYPDFSYPSFGGWDCMVDLGILGKHEDPFCVSNRETERIKHDAARELARAAHDGKREAERIIHQGKNEAKVSACNIAKEVTGFMALGSFWGNVAGSGNAMLNFSSFNFSEEMSKIDLEYSGELKSTIHANLNISPVDMGYIFLCFANYNKSIDSDINVEIPKLITTIDITAEKDAESLMLIMKMGNIDYDATINPSPLHALLTDPALFAICPSFVALIGLAAGIAVAIAPFLAMVNQLPSLTPEQKLLLMGTANGNYQVNEFKIPIKPIEFKINETQYKSQAEWKTKSIQFITLKP